MPDPSSLATGAARSGETTIERQTHLELVPRHRPRTIHVEVELQREGAQGAAREGGGKERDARDCSRRAVNRERELKQLDLVRRGGVVVSAVSGSRGKEAAQASVIHGLVHSEGFNVLPRLDEGNTEGG